MTRKRASQYTPDPRLLSETQSAFYWGVGLKKFKELVENKIAPPPIPAIRPKRWDRRHHDDRMDRLGGRNDGTDAEQAALAALN